MTTVVRADNLVVSREDRVVMSSSSFDITKGSIVAIIGPNGSGKSTLLDAITGLLPATSGDLTVLDTTAEKARERIAYVLQHISVTPGVPLTVKEVVTMGRYATTGLFGALKDHDRKQVSWAMGQLKIDDLAARHVDKLSGGQRQRVFVAQALAQDHDILLLDEPLTGLDIPSAKVIDDVIIANAFASEDELRALSEINPYKLTLDCTLEESIPEIEKAIVLNEFHFNRGDVSDYVIRSTQSRVKYKGHQFEPFNTPNMQIGDIIIETSLYAHYAGELQIALLPMENSGKSNIVGAITENDRMLLPYIKPWQKFEFNLVK